MDCLCLSEKALKFQTNLVTTSFMERKRNVVTIEKKLEIIDQLAIGESVSYLAACYNIGIVIRLSEKIDYSNCLRFQLFWINGVLLYLLLLLFLKILLYNYRLYQWRITIFGSWNLKNLCLW